jgi:hypothetical protein
MNKLSDITLLTVNCNNPDLGLMALLRSCRYLKFGAVKLLSHAYPKHPSPSIIAIEQIPNLTTLSAYNFFCITELHKYVQTPFVLSVQSDGFVINPQLWDDVFCDYDYIGAPWPLAVRGTLPEQRVGNSGFCLRSRRLLETTCRLATGIKRRKWVDDLFACSQAYPELIKLGMTYAPIEIAARFSFEMPMAGLPPVGSTFGFHGRRTRKTREYCASLVRELET